MMLLNDTNGMANSVSSADREQTFLFEAFRSGPSLCVRLFCFNIIY